MTSTVKQYLSDYTFAAACLLVVLAMSAATLFGQKPASDELQIQKCWEHKFDSGGDGRITAAGGAVYVVRAGSVIEAVAADSGKLLWTSDSGGAIDSNLIVEGDSVYFIRRTIPAAGTATEAALRAVSTSTGITRRSVAIGAGEGFSLGKNDSGLIAVSKSGEVLSFALADGTLRSRRQLATPIELPPIFEANTTLVVSDKKQIASFNGTGDPSVIAKSEYNISTVEPNTVERIYFGDERGNLTSFSTDSGSVYWQFKSGGGISDIIKFDGKVIAASNDNFVYALATFNGNRLWKRRVAGRVAALRGVGTETLLVQPLGDDNVILLAAKNGKVVGQIPVSSGEFVTGSAVPELSRIVILTDSGLYSYGIGGCPVIK
ncbi:MAG: PQQ-binding-like beta-propeller repeat protein [Pyrinomonadaceae bacterium]|nr:PQQ-binding-like beta-propeller repeat protein [Pyrinomonadaceae bacterium]